MASAAGDEQAWALRPDVVATVLDHGALLLDLELKYFYQLNPSGWALVGLFETGSTTAHALERCRSWGAPESEAPAIRAAIDGLRDAGLLESLSSVELTAGEGPASWEAVRIERQAQPLQRVIVSAFDPSIPLAE